MPDELRSTETTQESPQDTQRPAQVQEEASPEDLHAADNPPEKVQSASKWKFTPFQWVMVSLFGVLIVILIIFLIIYAFNGSGDDVLTDDAAETVTDAGGDDIDTSATPPKIEEDNDISTETEGVDDKEEDTKPEVKKADLYIKSYELDGEVTIGEEVTAVIVIANKGTAAAQNFRWEWWAEDDERECKEDIAVLNAGDERTVECNYTYDETDDYVTRVVVDAKNVVDEFDEDDNIITQDIEVVEKADLYVSNYEFDHDPVKGEEFTVRITIKNDGETDADEFVWEWWSTVTGSVACREEVSGLDAGDSKQVECDHTYAGWADYTTKAVVDADDDIDEGDESNNEYTQNVIPIH